jgi:hypothetical protein
MKRQGKDERRTREGRRGRVGMRDKGQGKDEGGRQGRDEVRRDKGGMRDEEVG